GRVSPLNVSSKPLLVQARVRWYARFVISSARSAVGFDEWRLRGRLGGSDAGVASLGGEEVVLLGSAADSCKEVGSGKLPTSFYSGCCGLFVPDELTAFMTHHAAAPFAMPAVLVVRRAPAGGGCRPYLCQVGRTVPCCRASRHACRTDGEVCACAR
ncbi:hypothetical protein B296_00057878, partial [Ensete ventricosum]